MQLDPTKCPPGTVGFLPTSNVYDFDGLGEGPQVFDEFKEPDVVLGEDRRWRSIYGDAVLIDAKVFSTWQAAVQYVIDEDRADCEAIIRAAQADMAQADKVQRWLNEAK